MCLGIPGQIETIVDHQLAQGTVNVAGIRRVVNLACVVEDVVAIEDLIGRWVLVHVGFAMSIIDEDEAQATLSLLHELGELMKSNEVS